MQEQRNNVGATDYAKTRLVLDIIATVAIVVAAGSFAFGRGKLGGGAEGKELSLPRSAVDVEGPERGDRRAPVVAVLYSDFECPFCARFATETMPTLETEYILTGKVRLVFRHLPLPIHRFARKAAETAECASQGGRFWALHDRLFSRQGRLDDAIIEKMAADLGFDARALDVCVPTSKARVDRDEASAKSFGLSGTPAILIGLAQPDGRVLYRRGLLGARPLDELRSVLDEVLKAATP